MSLLLLLLFLVISAQTQNVYSKKKLNEASIEELQNYQPALTLKVTF